LFGKYPGILTDEWLANKATSVLRCTSVLKSIERKQTSGQRYLRHSANQINDDDIELTDEKEKPLQTF
jgi:hypothetical protein